MANSHWFLIWSIPMVAVCPVRAEGCDAVQQLSPDRRQAVGRIGEDLARALDMEQFGRVDSLNRSWMAEFGDQAGLPEVLEPATNLPPLSDWINYDSARGMAARFVSRHASRLSELWRMGVGQAPPDNLPHSQYLRTSAEFATGLLRIAKHETDPRRRDSCLAWAMKTFDTLAGMQLASGAFPFPDLRAYGNQTFTPIIEKVLALAKGDTAKVLQEGWIVDDMGTGGFKFDAGVICDAFYQAWQMTGNPRYRQVSLKVADYLLPLKLNLNYNYNTFAALGLVRGFQLSGDSAYLRGAVANIRYGAIPGQLPSGRWVDGHNAKTVYQAIMVANTVPLVLALDHGESAREGVRAMLEGASRDLAVRTLSCGKTTGMGWLLALAELPESDLPPGLADTLRDLTDRHIQDLATYENKLDPQILGAYLDLVQARGMSSIAWRGGFDFGRVRDGSGGRRVAPNGRLLGDPKRWNGLHVVIPVESRAR